MSYDAIVIGGGPSGATAGALLARAGRRVAIVERAPFPRRKVCGEFISATTWPVLEELGIASRLGEAAAPDVTRVGLFEGDAALDAPMPASQGAQRWGRAVGREILDAELLALARSEGAEIFQPHTVRAVRRRGTAFELDVEADGSEASMCSPVVVAANGSWERDLFARPPAHAAGDLFGFKARFTGARLAVGLMPLVLFPGGYGGLVHTDANEVSFSCCIRRDALAAARVRHRGGAGEAVFAHAMESCRGLRHALEGAHCSGAWLSAGPIRPGVRELARNGLFRIGNAAGEAHPLVAEGISMAIQSGYLLARALVGRSSIDLASRDYARQWRQVFAARVHASRLFAAVTLPDRTRRAACAAIARMPAILTWGARWSGKARPVAPHAT